MHIRDVLLWGKFQHLKLIQSKVIQKTSFADVSIFAFLAIFIPITLFRQTKHLQHILFIFYNQIRFQKGMIEHLLVGVIGD